MATGGRQTQGGVKRSQVSGPRPAPAKTARPSRPARQSTARQAQRGAGQGRSPAPRGQATTRARTAQQAPSRAVTPRVPRAPKSAAPPANPVKRQRWLVIASAVVVALFVGRLVQVQVFDAPGLAAEALKQRTTTVTVPAHRGDITDRNGEVLATSVDRYTVSADPKAIQTFAGRWRTDADGEPVADGALGVAQLLAPVLGANQAELAAKINGDSQYVVLARDVEPEKQREIAALGLTAWIRTELVSQRVYPAGTVAGPLLGFVSSEQEGQGGLELAFDEVLTGKAGRETYEQSRDGVPIPGGEVESTPAVPGGNVQLTLDLEVQRKAQLSIDAAVAKSGAKYGIVLVEDLRTGELWAVADSGSVDPNDRSTAQVANGSRAVQDVFDPGSTAKVITMAAAMETGVFTADSQFTVPYSFTTPNGQVFHDSHDHPTWNLTLAGVLARSSNTGTVQIAEQIPPQVQYDYMQKFGFGKFTGLDLPGESRGILHPADSWDGRTRYAVAFGQSVSVNAVQAMDVFSTVGNHGVSVPPVLVKGTQAPGGEFVPTERATGTRVISKETSDQLLAMMEEVTSEEGTAAAAQIPGYRVAGKTGTAQLFLPGGGYTYMASFIGVAPADNPRFAVAAFLRSPQSSIYGGTVAAPVFRDVMSFVLQKEAVAPSAPAPEPIALTW